MKMFIPACGDRVHLVAPWSFNLYLERRNVRFAQELKLIGKEDKGDYRNFRILKASLPEGTTLECDRVYIRGFSKGAIAVGDDYDSISWKVMKGDKPAKHRRFWAKLPDCYEIDYELHPDSLLRNRVKAFKTVHES